MNAKAIKAVFDSFIAKNKKTFTFAAIALLGLLLAFCTVPKSSESKSTKQADSTELEEYTSLMEDRLSETVSAISGAGEAKVFITLEGTFETVYASNAKLGESLSDEAQSQKTTEKSLATANLGSNGETPVVVKRNSPKIKGVLIVCEGGNAEQVRTNVQQAAGTALNIPTNRIYVTGGNS